jgi:hypothetical protein
MRSRQFREVLTAQPTNEQQWPACTPDVLSAEFLLRMLIASRLENTRRHLLASRPESEVLRSGRSSAPLRNLHE